MAPNNNMKNVQQSDSSVESVVASPARRSRSMSMASQTSSCEQQRSSKCRHVTINSTGDKKSQQQQLRKSSSLPVETVEYLKAWMMSPEHIAHPYPTDQEKAQIMADTGIELKQLTNWFVNNRKRFWKPRVEARLQQQQAQQQQAAATAAVASVVPNAVAANCAIQQQQLAAATTAVSYVLASPQTAISFLNLDSLTRSPVPVSDNAITQPSVVSLTSTPVDPIKQNNLNTTTSISMVTAENLAAYLSPTNVSPLPRSPQTVVSELSSAASDGGSVDCSSSSSSSTSSSLTEQEDNHQHHVVSSESSDETLDEDAAGATSETNDTSHIETVDVHILRPLQFGRQEPTIEDVTILPNVPTARILRTFPNCALTYHNSNKLSSPTSRKRSQSRRDAEIVRIKKHYLRCYLAERERHVPEAPVLLGKRVRAVVQDEDADVDTYVNSDSESKEEQERIQPEPPESTISTTPRLKYRRVSANPDEFWRLVCQMAVHPHDEDLPSLEEAAHMFGFAAVTATTASTTIG